MTLVKQIKIDALKALKEKWPITITMILISLCFALIGFFILQIGYLITQTLIDKDLIISGLFEINMPLNEFVFSLIAYGVLVFAVITITILIMGQKKWFYRHISNKDTSPSVMFSYFKPRVFINIIKLKIALWVKIFFWGVCSVIPGITCVNLYLSEISNPIISDEITAKYPDFYACFLLIIGMFLLVLSAVIVFMLNCRYFICDYLFILNPETTTLSIMRKARQFTKGQLKLICKFHLSFLGYVLLCLLIVPVFFIVPYINSSMAIFAKYMITLGSKVEKFDTETKSKNISLSAFDEI